ncbi:MAG: DUF5676 family membrane protein [Burkholderiales bacterium]
MNKVNPWVIGATAAATFAILYSTCAAAYALFPNGTMAFFNAWFHGFDFTLLKADKPFTAGTFIYGLLSVAVTSFVTGLLFGSLYNLIQCDRQHIDPDYG